MGDYKTVKKLTDIDIQGVSIDVERHNGAFKAVTIRDGGGRELRIASENGYGLSVLVPRQPDPVLRYFVVGERDGKPLEEKFSEDYAADARVHHLKALGVEARSEAREVVEAFDDRVPQ